MFKKIITIQYDIFDLSFIFFVAISQTVSVINRSGACFFYMHQTSGTCAGMCACDCTHQMAKTASLTQCF